MPRKLLLDLNGTSDGLFRRWLDNCASEPRIAWYPSAGLDFRAIFFLHENFSNWRPASKTEPPPPDIFLYTDFGLESEPFPFFENNCLLDDGHTRVTVKEVEELPRCDLPVEESIVTFAPSSSIGRVLFFNVEVVSDRFGTITKPVIYAFVENSAFCAKKIIPNKGKLSHVIHVRYGGGFGGSRASGCWLLNILRKVNCEIFITDGHLKIGRGEPTVYRLFPTLRGNEDRSQLEQIRVIPGVCWSGHGDVSWNLIKPGEEPIAEVHVFEVAQRPRTAKGNKDIEHTFDSLELDLFGNNNSSI